MPGRIWVAGIAMSLNSLLEASAGLVSLACSLAVYDEADSQALLLLQRLAAN